MHGIIYVRTKTDICSGSSGVHLERANAWLRIVANHKYNDGAKKTISQNITQKPQMLHAVLQLHNKWLSKIEK